MKLHITWAILFILLLGILAAGGFFYIQDKSQMQELFAAQAQEIQEMREAQVKGLQTINLALQEYRTGAEQENEDLEQLLSRQESQFKSQLQDLERKKELSEQILSSSNEDLAENLESLTDKIVSLESNSKADIVRKWDDITVRISCEYETAERSFGSGLYFGPNSAINFGAGNEHAILTNSHVLEEDNEVPTSCVLTWGAGAQTVLSFAEDPSLSISRTSFFEGFDAAYITLTQEEVAATGIDSSIQYDLCSIAPQSGDEILVLGYPKIGSTETVTSTEGIISGYDGNFFITSAKISKGNSGGAAISVKNDCYFGIPTLVKTDAVESLGRILDITNIFE